MKKLSENNRIVFGNTLGAFAAKGASLIIALFTTPAFIKYFNDNTVLGVWYTVLSVMTWFLNFDLGIGNGIRNNLVKDLTSRDCESAKRTVSSGMFSILVVTSLLIAIGVPLISLIDLSWLYNISTNIVSEKVLYLSTVFVFVGIMLRFFFTTISSVFYALQKSAVNDFLSLCVSIFQLVFVMCVTPATSEQGLLILSIAYIVISNAPIAIAGIVVFCTELKHCRPNIRYIDTEHIKKVLGIGSVFFICQILYMLIMNTNDFFITNIFGPQYTTEYSFYYKLTSIISMVISLAMTPMWSAITKAMAEQQYDWVDKVYRIIKFIGVGAAALQFLFIPIEQILMNLWLGDNSIAIDYMTALAFACYGSVFVYSSALSTIVCGMARMKLQMLFYLFGVVVKFVLVWRLADVVQSWDIVVWSNFAALAPYCIVQQIDLNKHIRKLRSAET